MIQSYDIIVVGAGHAGCEAATAAAKLGSSTLLITMDMDKIAAMSCNPAVGGVAKGQIVREIDALGGMMGIISDKSTIQFRMLNRSKGPAMWSPRAQCDKYLYSKLWRECVENTPNLYIWQDSVSSLIVEQNQIKGVQTELGMAFGAKSVILTAGTFLNGKIHIGLSSTSGGRMGDRASYGLSEQLRELGFEVDSMKTGTPARFDGRTIDFSKMIEQKGDDQPAKFSFLDSVEPVKDQRSCYLVYTSQEIHDTLRKGFDSSPLFTGRIKGIGPRYCPSIEDKLNTFADKSEHQLFLEPEGNSTNEYYLNGFSSSLPWEVQLEALRKIEGFENVHVFKPGYAIEYDFFPPTQLRHTLETKNIDNLYFAGQINGTTGYEEAASQGLLAGINAHLKLNGGEPLILSRDEAYIGVLIDDLVSKGVDEPYRMFTSRAEYRILLRQDNADLRLTPIGHRVGLVSSERFEMTSRKEQNIDLLTKFIKNYSVSPQQVNSHLNSLGQSELTQKRKLMDLAIRNGITLNHLIEWIEPLKELIQLNNIGQEVVESCEILIKYGGYIERERLMAQKLHRLESIKINPEFDFHALSSLSIESRQKLTKIRPQTIGQASRIPGVSPSDINVLLVYFGR